VIDETAGDCLYAASRFKKEEQRTTSLKSLNSRDTIQTMYLVQILLPLYNNSEIRFEPERYTKVRDELVSRFGGITAYTRTPVQGLWHEREEIVRDDLIIYEIMVQELKEEWWCEYRKILENRFEQQSLVVRANQILLL
jgi:hypothetical protein